MLAFFPMFSIGVLQYGQFLEERGLTQHMNFEVFMQAIIDLPDTDTPSLLPFNDYIFRTFILKSGVWKDEIHYGTSFGLTLIAVSNCRPASHKI